MNSDNPSSNNDTTWELFDQQKGEADRLLEQVEALQNALANAKRRHDKGDEVDIAKIADETKKKLRTLEQSLIAFPGRRQNGSNIVDLSAKDVGESYWQHIAKRKTGVPTGLNGLNEMMSGGLEPQRLYVLLGAPGGGKTTLANQIAASTSDAGHPVFYVTSEDQPFTLFAKTIARRGGIKYTAVLKGYEDERVRIDQTIAAYNETPSAERLHYLDASAQVDLEIIRDRAKAHFERYQDGGQAILVIDYLQRLARALSAYRNGVTDLRQAVTQLTEQLRAIAVELNCCVIALASQNRASGYGAANNALATAKESGDVEYTADVIMALGDDTEHVAVSPYLAPKVLRIDKNRIGQTDILKLDWYADRQQFTEYKVEEGQEPTVSTIANGNGNSNGRRGGKR